MSGLKSAAAKGWFMCERKDNEPLMVYWFRQLVEKPTPFIALCCMGGMVYLYNDVQSARNRNAEVQLRTVETLNSVTAQMQVINQQLADLKQFHLEERKK